MALAGDVKQQAFVKSRRKTNDSKGPREVRNVERKEDDSS